MYIVKYSARVHEFIWRRTHELASASRHMNECRIFHNIHPLTFLLYTVYILSSSFIRTVYIRNQNIIAVYQSKNCFKFETTLCHLVSSYNFKTTPNGAKMKITFGI